MDTKEIRKLIIESGQAPGMGRLSTILVELSGWSAYLSQQLEDILVFKADRLQELRTQYKTVRETSWGWNATNEGKQEIRLHSQIKYLANVMSAIKMRLRTREGESWGRY